MANVKLTRLKIEKYRNVAPGTELVFNDTFNVPLGQNGTGKTTLLDLVAMIIRSDFAVLKDEEFSIEYDLIFLDTNLVSTHIENRRRAPTSDVLVTLGSLSIDMSNVAGEALDWRYSVSAYVPSLDPKPLLTLTADPQRTSIEVDSDEASPKAFSGSRSPFDTDLRRYFMRLLATALRVETPAKIETNKVFVKAKSALLDLWVTAEQLNENLSRNSGRFDEALGGFSAITGSDSGARGGDLHETLLLIEREKEKLLTMWSFVPEDVYKLFTQGDLPTPHPEGVRLKHSDLPFLQRAVEILGFKAVDVLFKFRRKDVNGARETTFYNGFEFVLTLDDDTIIRHDLLSYGQKRLLSFFYYVAATGDVIVADELVNGLHYAWIEACLREIGDRQAFLTSQNPLLLDFLPFESAEQVQHTFILCRTEKRDGKTWMVWSNMSAESAETFYRAYKTEALQVSEILRSRGLW